MMIRNNFSEDLKKIMVMKLLQPTGPSVLELSSREGISKTALYSWLKNIVLLVKMIKVIMTCYQKI